MPAAIRCIALALAFAFVTLVAAGATAAPAAAEPTPITYVPPVDAPIHDPFRAPTMPFGSGHRGIEYDTAPGTSVTASAPGTVAFAGTVAGSRWVTIDHSDGVRTTYGPLATAGVQPGQRVGAGEAIGTTAGRLLLTARVGDNYVDPALLLSTGDEVHLVPEPTALPSFPPASFGFGDLLSPDTVISALAWTRDRAADQVDAVYGVTPAPFVLHAVNALVRWHEQQQHCTSDNVSAPAPPGRRFAVLVGGLGSSSDNASIDDVDTTALGYDARDVVRFSYAGGRIPSSGPVSAELADVDVTTYAPHDTGGDLDAAGRRLADLVREAVAKAPPGTTVDLYAHSQGGLVTRVALQDLASSDPTALRRLGVVVTLATPHQGAELAGLLERVTRPPGTSDAVDALAAAAGTDLRAEDLALNQLAPGSDLLRRLASEPLPEGPRYVSIAAQGDPVVPSPDAWLQGAENVIVPVVGIDAHADLPGSAPAAREMALALAGLPPSCESAADVVLDAAWGDLFQSGERLLTVTRGP